MPEQTIKNTNPCGICRAMGAAGCRGHGGGGGDGGDRSEEHQESQTFEHQPSPQQLLELAPLLGKEGWLLKENNVYSFHNFNPNAALNSIQLDFKTLELRIKPKEVLEPEPEADKNSLFEKIKELVMQMGGEVEINSHGELEITLSDPKHFVCLVSNLMDQNLLPIKSNIDLAMQNTQAFDIEEPEAPVSSNWPPKPAWVINSSSDD